MDIDWTRHVIQIGLIAAIYFTLKEFSPLPRQSRGAQFAIFGGIVFSVLLVLGVVWR